MEFYVYHPINFLSTLFLDLLNYLIYHAFSLHGEGVRVNSWQEIMEDYPARINISCCAWNSCYTKHQIENLLPKLGLHRQELALLRQLLKSQNSKTGRLDITNKSLEWELNWGRSTVKTWLASLFKKLKKFIIVKHYFPGEDLDIKKRRQVIIFWDNLLEKTSMTSIKEEE